MTSVQTVNQPKEQMQNHEETQQSKFRIDPFVSEQLSTSMGLWNQMMEKMQSKTDLQTQKVPLLSQSQHLPSSNALNFQKTQATAEISQLRSVNLPPRPLSHSVIDPSNPGVDDGTKQLLDKYSDILLQTIQ
mmetsp:Transcript_5793/g.9921  ORF Transcript_5793/g.9921 Transcript_5793/m.9921 type:complete len:132 (-) Transcript_5793:60-455(-)